MLCPIVIYLALYVTRYTPYMLLVPGAYTLFIVICCTLSYTLPGTLPGTGMLQPSGASLRRLSECRSSRPASWTRMPQHTTPCPPSPRWVHTCIPVHSYQYIYTSTFIHIHTSTLQYHSHLRSRHPSACVCAPLSICVRVLGHLYVRSWTLVCASFCVCMRVLLRSYVRPSAFVCAPLGICMRLIISSLCILYGPTWTRVCAPLVVFMCVLGHLYARPWAFVCVDVVERIVCRTYVHFCLGLCYI